MFTYFTKIEAMLNSCALCRISTNPEDCEYLTLRGHFIIGGQLLARPEPSLLDRKEHLIYKITAY